MEIFYGLLIPFLGTTLGASMVFLVKNNIKESVQKLLLGFASGVMIAASVWSLLIPAIEMSSEQGKVAWVAPAIGFMFGIVFLLVLDTIIPHMHLDKKSEGIKSNLKKATMLVLAVTLHNIPEGMAVGVVFAGALTQNAGITLAGAFALAIGIAIQNFPEGAIISMPLKAEGVSRKKSFLYGMISRNSRTHRSDSNNMFNNYCCTNIAIFTFICSWGNDICCGRRINSRVSNG